jgi:hypothetical protein
MALRRRAASADFLRSLSSSNPEIKKKESEPTYLELSGQYHAIPPLRLGPIHRIVGCFQ